MAHNEQVRPAAPTSPEQAERARSLAEHFPGGIHEWGPRPLDNGSLVPAQNDPPQSREGQ